MAAVLKVTQADILAAAKIYCNRVNDRAKSEDEKISISEGEDKRIRFIVGGVTTDHDIMVWTDNERLKSNDPEFAAMVFSAILKGLGQEPTRATKPAQKPAERVNVPAPQRSGQIRPNGAMPRDAQISSLTTEDITAYLCPKATEQEAYMFLQLCKARGLNPFLKEAYLIKYSDNNPATMVVGKEHFTKTAEKNPQFDGFEAGIILRTEAGSIERREGTFMTDGETLLGGWAKVWRKDRSKPFVSDANLKDFIRKTQSGRSPWDTMPAVMIRKVPLVQSLREAFPNDLSGCYDRAEMDQAIDAEYEVQG